MILTYKIKHNKNFSNELFKAKQVAEFAIKTRTLSSKDVAHFGLKSAISNQILRKYGKNKKIKQVKNIKLTIPSQAIKLVDGGILILCLKLQIPFNKTTNKIHQIEIDNTYAYVSCEALERPIIKTKANLGVDLNTTGHCAVAGCPETGKVFKLGKKANHIHQKYKAIRKNLQKKGEYKKVKQLKNRESRIVKDLNHKISRFIVNTASNLNASIKIEDLKGIRKNKKNKKSFRYALNSWSFYQLRQFIEYKAKLAGIPVIPVDPHYTSQTCSKCGLLGIRNGKLFKCPYCGHVENADVNASFNIGVLSDLIQSITQLCKDRDLYKGNADIPKEAPVLRTQTLEPMSFSL